MRYIKTNNYPFANFKAITHYPIGVFYKGMLNETTKRHEAIHWQQQKELLILPFYLIYFVEWIFKGYKDISFEKEAYNHDNEDNYLKIRKLFGMWRG